MNYKANSFLGWFSIRTGLFIIAALQIAGGIGTYVLFHFFRPSLYRLQVSLLLFFIASAALGAWGAWKRNRIVEMIYLGTFVVITFITLMIALEFAGLVHFFPKAPIHSQSNFLAVHDALRYAGLEKAPQPLHLHLNEPRHAHAHEHRRIKAHPTSFVQTAAESEELDPQELPLEMKHMSSKDQEVVTSVAKLNRQPLKVFIGLLMSLDFLFYLYSCWIIVTFILNKCTSLDELTGQPEQFEPLVGKQ